MRKRIFTLAAMSVMIFTSVAAVSANSYRGSRYCVKTFNTSGGKVTASVSYAKNTSLLKDTVVCIAHTSGDIAVTAYCSYNENLYKTKFLSGTDNMTEKETRKNVSNAYTYGKLHLDGDVNHTLYADE